MGNRGKGGKRVTGEQGNRGIGVTDEQRELGKQENKGTAEQENKRDIGTREDR